MPAKKGATTKKTVQKLLEEVVTDNYTVQLYVSGIKYTVEAPTLEEALYMLRPSFLRGRVVITVTHGNKKKERILQLSTANQLFNTRGILKTATIKNYLKLFDL